MSSYRKTMGEAYNGMYLVEGNIDKIKDIVSKKSASKIDGVTVDMFTASAISQIYDKVNDANKKKMEKLPITKLAALAMKMMKNEYVPEEVDLDEAIPTSSAYALVIQQKDGSREIVAKGSKEKIEKNLQGRTDRLAERTKKNETDTNEDKSKAGSKMLNRAVRNSKRVKSAESRYSKGNTRRKNSRAKAEERKTLRRWDQTWG